MPTERTWQEWLERLYNLRRDKRGSHERPHKPVLLLSILDLLDRGQVKANQIALTPELIKTFRRYFDVVRREDDQPSMCPNHHRAMDRFLIAPCPDSKHRAGIWRVGPALDPRIEGQKALVALDGQRVIAPAEEKFYPAIESLRWREKHLSAKF